MNQVRIYCPYFPYPFNEAAFQTMFNQAASLVKLGFSVEMVVWKSTVSDAVRAMKNAPEDILKAGFQVRFFSGDAKRLYSLERLKTLALEEAGLPIAEDNRLKRVLSALASGYASPELFYYPPEMDLRAELPPVDIAIYHYSFSYAWLKKNPAIRGKVEKKQIVHFHNLECDVFRARAADEKSLVNRVIHLLNAGRLDRHERALSGLVDQIWQHSPIDMQDYKMRTGYREQRVLPPSMSRAQWETRKAHFLEKMNTSAPALRVGFVGGLDFEPNRSSAAWILGEVAPLLKRGNFQGKLVFAGKGAPAGWLDRFPKYDFIEFLGFVPSLEDYWASLSFLLVPHISGGGVRLKLLEALGSQLPVMANTAAVQRLSTEVRSSPLLWVNDAPQNWSDKILHETAFSTRKSLFETPFCEGIDGERLYKFLRELS